jgi:ComF family protein
MNIFQFLKDILWPKKCYSCHQEAYFLCPDCYDKIWSFSQICPVCKEQSRDFEVHFYCKNKFVYYDKIIILTHYKNKVIKKLITDAKFHHKKDILEDFAVYLWNKLFCHIDEKPQDIILIPTPIYFWKKLSRWYNQSEILAKNIWEMFHIEYNFKMIKKIKKTQAQSHLSKIERQENLQWSLIMKSKIGENLKQKTFIIVDDVFSTWTTINEMAKLLKQKWVKKVYGLCIASD